MKFEISGLYLHNFRLALIWALGNMIRIAGMVELSMYNATGDYEFYKKR